MTQSLGSDDAFLQRLGWWLHLGFSSEHWLQFELAYRLSAQLAPTYFATCELGKTDINVLLTDTGFNGPTVAGIELKWHGNWWTKDIVANHSADIAKISGTSTPSLAIMICAVATPEDNRPRLDWMRRAIAGPHGCVDYEMIRTHVLPSLPPPPDIDFSVACGPVPGFRGVEIWALGYANNPGKAFL